MDAPRKARHAKAAKIVADALQKVFETTNGQVTTPEALLAGVVEYYAHHVGGPKEWQADMVQETVDQMDEDLKLRWTWTDRR